MNKGLLTVCSAHQLPLRDGVFHACVMSPPYYGLRMYEGEQIIEWPTVAYSPMVGIDPITIPGCDPECEHEWITEQVYSTRTRNVRSSEAFTEPGEANIERLKKARWTEHSWCSKCGGWRGALGAEPSIEMYIGHMVLICREIKRVLRPDGTFWLNVADSYSGSGGAGGDYGPGGIRKGQPKYPGRKVPLLQNGDLIGMPARLALALQADGWIWRNDCIWAKHPMPEPLKGWRWERPSCDCVKEQREAHIAQQMEEQGVDRHRIYDKAGTKFQPVQDCPRCNGSGRLEDHKFRSGSWRHTKSHEYVLQFTQQMGYYSDHTRIAEPGSKNKPWSEKTSWKGQKQSDLGQQKGGNLGQSAQTAGRNPRSMLHAYEHMTIEELWEEFFAALANPADVLTAKRINYSGKHFAVFPPHLIAPLIHASVPKKCCSGCGKPWAPVIESSPMEIRRSNRGKEIGGPKGRYQSSGTMEKPAETRVLGYRPTCGCHLGLTQDDLETISTPLGKKAAHDPSLETGRAGLNRPRNPDQGIRSITRYEQRKYAEQLKTSPHRKEMETEAGKEAFAHYIRMDKSGARPAPPKLLDQWIKRGWITEVDLPNADEPDHVPGIVLDPFMGSGTTGLVAREFGVNFVGCDISFQYLDEQAKIRSKTGTPSKALDGLPLFEEIE